MTQPLAWKIQDVLGGNGQIDPKKLERAWEELLHYFVGSEVGVGEGDLPFEYVTEGRASRRRSLHDLDLSIPYNPSSDLPHAMVYNLIAANQEHLIGLQRMFVGKFINRHEYLGWRDRLGFVRLRHGVGKHFKAMDRHAAISLPSVAIVLAGDRTQERALIPQHATPQQLIGWSYEAPSYTNESTSKVGHKKTYKMSKGADGAWLIVDPIQNTSLPFLGYVDVLGWLQELIEYNAMKPTSWLVRVPLWRNTWCVTTSAT